MATANTCSYFIKWKITRKEFSVLMVFATVIYQELYYATAMVKGSSLLIISNGCVAGNT